MSEFINLRNYSENTFLTGTPNAIEYPKIAKKKGLSAVALTDKNNTHGVIYFYKEAKNIGIKPLIGVNILFEKRKENILIFPKSNRPETNGYRNFNLIISELNLKSDKNFFDISKEELGFNIYVIAKETVDEKGIEYIKNFFDGVLGSEVYFEFQPGYGEDYFNFLLNKGLKDYIIFSNPTYFIDKNEVELKLIKKAIKDGVEIFDIKDDFSEFYFKDKNQLKNSFGFKIEEKLFNEILNNTKKIVDSINIDIKFGENLIPTFKIEGEDLEIYNKYAHLSKYKMSSDEWYFRYLCYSNFEYRYGYKLSFEEIIELVNKDDFIIPEKGLTETSIDELKELSRKGFSKEKEKIISKLDDYGKNLIYRLEYELYVIHNMGFDAYFLIVSDYINRAKRHGISVGPGRGSVAGSISAYLTKITDIDPIKYGLLFERFLNPARISMPDIDVDFADINRQDVIDYCSRKYGYDKVASVCTFGTMAARSSLKDVGRVMGIEAKEMNRFAGLISRTPGTKLRLEYKENEKFRLAVESSITYKEIYNYALKIEGHKRQLGVHACATIIAPRPLTDFCPVQYPPKVKGNSKTVDKDGIQNINIKNENTVITQFDAHNLEDLGLLKMDFLGLKNMTIIQNTLKLIKERKNIEIDLSKISLYDEKVYEEVFSRGETTGIFQFESNGMRKYLKELKPNKFEELIAMVALYRPGPLEFIPSFINRKHGREPIKYLNPVLEDLMKETYGHCVHGDTFITLANGENIQIKNLYKNQKKYIGKKVLSYNEKNKKIEKKVINFLFNNGKKEFVRVIYGNGCYIDVTKEHKLYVYNKNTKNIEIKKVIELTNNDYILELKQNIDTKNTYNKDKALIVAYLLGCGDIWKSKKNLFISSELKLIEEFKKAIKNIFFDINISTINSLGEKGKYIEKIILKNNVNNKYNNILLGFLHFLGLDLKTKFIPNEIINADNDTKAYFIAKLWDCSGYISKDGIFYYKTTSKDVYDGLLIMLKSLGIEVSSSYYKNNVGNVNGKNINYILFIKDNDLFYNICGKYFLNIKKKNKLKKIKGNNFGQNNVLQIFKTFNMYQFKNIVDIGVSTAYDMEVDGNHNYFGNRVLMHNCIFQEQIMLMSQVYAGYSMSEADELRKGIRKKKKDIIEKHEEKFINGAVKKGYDREEAENIYKKIIVPAGSYSFNKSHRACYALIAYQTAFLKTYYPSEYITACFYSDYDDQKRVALFTKEAIRLGIKILPPDINKSECNYKLEKEGVILMGLATIKGIGLGPSEEIVKIRKEQGEYKDFKDFLLKGKNFISKKVLDGLCQAGALDSFIDQNLLMENIKTIIDFSKGKLKKEKKIKKIEELNVIELFNNLEKKEEADIKTDNSILLPIEAKPTTGYEKAVRQLTALGVMVSTHPLSGLSKYIYTVEKNREILFGLNNNHYMKKDEKRVTCFGYINDFKISKDLSGREIMTIDVIGVDYEIKAKCSAEKTEEYRYEIENSIGKYIDITGIFSISIYGRILNVEKLMVIDPLKHIERMSVIGLYNNKEILDINKVYLYGFTKINPYINLFVTINPGQEKEKLIGYLKDFKDFLMKQESGFYHVYLKDVSGNVKDTKFYIKDYKSIINFFKRVKKWGRLFVEDKEQKLFNEKK